ncbi:MAG: lipopolysaccharide heptosyltransferase II [Myxococcota bacterium]
MSAEPAPRRILVRCPNPVGDAVMATPALRALRRAQPRAEITLLGPASHSGLLSGLDSFDHFLPIRGNGLGEMLARLRVLRARHFDWAVLLPDSPRVALEAWLAGARRRAGYARDPLRRQLLNDPIEPPLEGGRRMPFSMIERYLRITRLFGAPDAGTSLDLRVDADASERVAARLAALGRQPAERLLVVAPGAAFGPSKLWPPRHFARACDLLQRRFGLVPVLVAAPNDTEIRIVREVASLARERCISLADTKGDLEDLKALVGAAALVVCNDTGTRHVAVALERPVITLMGPTDPRHTHHLLERQRVLYEAVECRPCGRPTCPIDHRCLVNLPPERVLEAAAELLD